MRVCFVYPDIAGVEHYGAIKYYHGIGYLSSVLKQAGHETALIYLQQEPTRDEFIAQVQTIAPHVVAFSSTTHQHPFAEKCASWIKEGLPGIITLVGGTHATLVPDQVLSNPAFDLVCVGEGEQPLLELVTALSEGRDYSAIPNIWLRHNGERRQNTMRPLLANLDDLPFPDRELFRFEDILARNDGWVDMMVGRGCPYQCSYCCNPALRERYRGLGKYVRFRSVENVLAEIRAIAARYAVRTLNFQDDVFTLDRNWTIRFCREYASEFSFPFWINTRAERINDEEVVQALAAAGCCGVRIGLESGNESLRAEILKRHMTNDEIRNAFALARKHHLQVYTCNMLGIPGETREMIAETVNLNRALEPEDLQFSVFYPYPMTELYDVSVKHGLFVPGQSLPTYYGPQSVLQLPTLTASELRSGYADFQQLKSELRMRRESPLKYRFFRRLSSILGDAGGAWSIMRALSRVKSLFKRGRGGQGA